jgi:4-hydroxybenzoate polyprenyltransferase
MLRLMRVHQWIKNVFVLAPLFFTPEVLSVANIGYALIGFLCFCALSSAVYIINDYADRATDRLHPSKASRPLASGAISTRQAFILMAALMAVGLGVSYTLSVPFFLVLLAYFLLNLAYSFALKHVAILDVIVIALGFVLRVEGGGQLIGIDLSVWIVICAGLLALFLAIAKRRDDLIKTLDEEHRLSLAGYNKSFLDASLTLVLGALLVSYVIYTTDAQVIARMGSDKLYLTVPFVLAGILRYLQITLVEERSESPTLVVLTDRFLIVTILGWIATFAVLIYG